MESCYEAMDCAGTRAQDRHTMLEHERVEVEQYDCELAPKNLGWKWSHEKLIRMEVENYDFFGLVRGCLPLAVANGVDTRLSKHWVST